MKESEVKVVKVVVEVNEELLFLNMVFIMVREFE